MDATRNYHTKWSKSERERQIPYDITYMWSLKLAQMNLFTKQKQIHRHRAQTCGCQGGRGEGVGWTGSLVSKKTITFLVDKQWGPTV